MAKELTENELDMVSGGTDLEDETNEKIKTALNKKAKNPQKINTPNHIQIPQSSPKKPTLTGPNSSQ